jgi:formylglycine-generating enzyme required for sulfatase activity
MRSLFAFSLLTLAVLPARSQTNSIGMEFVQVPAGEFVMGKFAPTCAPVGFQDNVTEAQHNQCVEMARQAARLGFTVTIERPFSIGKYEVTQAQYQKVMGTNPAFHTREKVGEDTANYPVDSITWPDAQAFVKKLNALEKTKQYRLPTEAEWEYAARAGTTDDTQGAKRPEVAWFMSSAKYATHPVGQKRPNAWGIYDMLGNVWEWVSDFYDEQVQPAGPKGPAKGKVHVLRGGGFNAHDKNTRVNAHAGGPGTPIAIGFRIVRDSR